MSSVGAIKASYRANLRKYGEVIKIRRYAGSGPVRPMFECEVYARISGYQPNELVGGIAQADRKAIVLHEDLVNAGFALPITNADFAVVAGKQHAIRVPDNMTRRVAGVTIAYELQIVG